MGEDARAWPDRYEVTRRGVADPAASRYVVLDIVHDLAAREALARLVGFYRRMGALASADRLEEFLESTKAAFAAAVAAHAQGTRPVNLRVPPPAVPRAGAASRT